MDYYKQKILAFSMIDELVSNGTDIEIIYFKVETRFGFGKKLVDLRLKSLENLCISGKKGQKKVEK